ncbi:MAG: I78 family peptidase inhibitor [Salibaculum sp.]|uniref:I78 family peptidase inhibitor n=2 Tax=Roseobacteraceae TaxID=2854170 RepID=UPI00287026C9|nr:I78 family peptidase inhibitor [Salibaculum sp.]MDR9426906.1 I78 family peptidase inhibitor [Salibaculum sp.]MDR9481458.1 I78 family peptidase inhibitor [Salibaculum sp.]
MAPSDTPQPEVPPESADSCGARAHAGLIGQDATALERVLIMGPVRVIRPGTAVTMDHRPDRINFMVSEAERITRIYCG